MREVVSKSWLQVALSSMKHKPLSVVQPAAEFAQIQAIAAMSLEGIRIPV